MVGVPGSTSSVIRSSLMITITVPAGPIFFWTPPYRIPYFVTSMGSERKQEETSATSSFPLVSGSVWNAEPNTVLFWQI